MINVQKFRHVAIIVKNLEKMVDFYTTILGFELKRTFEIESEDFRTGVGLTGAKAKEAQLVVPNSDVEIELFEFIHPKDEETDQSVPNKLGYRHIALIVDDLISTFETLKNKGVEFISDPITPEEVAGSQWVYLRDPEGNRVEFVASKRINSI